MVAERYPPHIGGAPFCIHQLSVALVRLGHHVQIVTSREPNTLYEEEIDGVEVFRFDRSSIPRFKGLSFILQAYRRLSALSKVHDYDLIHCHNGICGLVGYLWGRRFGKPYVVTSHGSLATSMKAGPLVRYVVSLIEEFSVKNADASTFDGSSLLEDFVTSTGIDRQKTSYIPNAVDPEVFSPREYTKTHSGINPDSVNIMYVGRLVPGKGLFTLLDAFCMARNRFPELSLVVVGEGSYLKRMKENLRGRVEKTKASFLGAVPHSDLPDIYAADSIVVLPSVSEGLSRVLLEAMACEKPVIATDIPANLSLVRNEVNGLIVPLGDVELLAEAILRLAKDKNLRSELGKEARKTILRDYVVDKRVKRMLDVYEAVFKSFRQDKIEVTSSI
jgi:glycosyltransferase involved in cell wall biosynthesis